MLNKNQREIEQERMKNKLAKLQSTNQQLNYYNDYFERKKVDDQKKIEERLKEKALTSLNMNHEQRTNQFKQYIGKLDEKVEKNMEYHKQYMQQENRNSPKHSREEEKNNSQNSQNNSQQYIPPMVYDEQPEPKQSRNEYYPQQQEIRYTPHQEENKVNNIQRDINRGGGKSFDQAVIQTPNDDFFNFVDNRSQNVPRINHNVSSGEFVHKNNQNYKEYYNVKRDYLNYNKSLVENKAKINQDVKDGKRKVADERMKDMEKNHYLENEMKRGQIEQQKLYRGMLDSQKNEKGNPINVGVNSRTDDHSFQYKNVTVPVAPYTEKKYEIGGSILEHNPILNPVPYYKNNKYLYREALNNSLKFVGNNIIG